ncbi:MAG: SUMF1/EgtB/PvdO family nonheme iron enzyme [Sorangiineae bacterium]|nr:SUMF1/EgtB/PvdO family nonheme iron enzyme [Polyangiaceae bacterium]MEB2322227.1 SUMF1/EgtB/PvdO family nonheme iron enzyme [Sorangiineae bacterium]
MRRTLLRLTAVCCGAAACGGAATTPTAPSPATRASADPPAPAPREAPAAPAPGDPTSAADECPEGMVKVDGGTLWMGSPDGVGAKDEHPQHRTELLAFCMDAREVTVGAYAACVKNAICEPLPTEVQLLRPQKSEAHEAASALCTGGMRDSASLPLNCADARLAEKYCEWKGRRLPTEAEWEFAATGGEDKLSFPWGAAPPSAANACFGVKTPCPAGSKPPGAFGLFDLAGSLSEWTRTAYGPYPTPPDSSTATAQVIRGGSFRSTKPEELSPKRRASAEPLFADVTVGFRCAKDL